MLDFHYSNLEFACGATLSEVRSHIHCPLVYTLQKWCYCYTNVSPLVTLSTPTITPSPHTLPFTFSLALFLLSHTPPLKVSSFHWDHNDNFAQFSGCHALLPDGYMSILSRLAEGLEIHLNNPVKRIEFMSDGRVGVTDFKGKLWAADRVIITL